jgi:hypothetical protein
VPPRQPAAFLVFLLTAAAARRLPLTLAPEEHRAIHTLHRRRQRHLPARHLLPALDAEWRDIFARLEDARRRAVDLRGLSYRQRLAMEGLHRFLVGDDARARDLLDQLVLPRGSPPAPA